MKGVAFVTHRDVTVHRGRVVAYLYQVQYGAAVDEATNYMS